MKFKAAIIGILSAILVICAFTSYKLITEAEKQIEFQKLQAEISIKTFEAENASRIWLDTEHGTIERSTYLELYGKYNDLCREK